MTHKLVIALGLLIMFCHSVHGAPPTNFGILMATPFKTFIQKVTVSLKVPATPNPQHDIVNIFPSLAAIQEGYTPNLSSYGKPSNFNCSAAPGQWCAASTLYNYSESKITDQGATRVVKPGDTLQYTIEQVPFQYSYVVTVSRGGQILSQITGGEEVASIFYLRGECVTNPAKLPAYRWTDLSVTLALKYPDYAKEAELQEVGVTTTPLYTKDGGLTWKIDQVNAPAVSCIP